MPTHRLRAAATTLVLAGALLSTTAGQAMASSSCPVAAHRGGPRAGATENGMEAATRAVTAGVEYLEVDAQLTADHQWMLMHDGTIDRTTDGRGPVAGQRAAALRRVHLDAGGRIPYLWQVTDLVRTRDRRLFVDLKGMDRATASDYVTLARTLRRDGTHRFVVTARSLTALRRIRHVMPHVRTAVVTNTAPTVALAEAAGGSMVLASAADATLSAVTTVSVYVWGADTEAVWADVSGRAAVVVTDHPYAYLTWRAANCPA